MSCYVARDCASLNTSYLTPRRCKQGRQALGTSANENGIKLSPSGVRGRGSERWEMKILKMEVLMTTTEGDLTLPRAEWTRDVVGKIAI